MSNVLVPSADCGVLNSSYHSNALLTIGHYGFEMSEKNKAPVTSKYPAYRLHFIIKGEVLLRYGKQTAVLKRNSVFVLIPDEDISYTTGKKRNTELYWVTYNGSLSGYYTMLMGMNKTHPYNVLQNSGIIRNFYDCFTCDLKNENQKEITLLKNFYAIAENIIKFGNSSIGNETPISNKNTNLATSAIQYINNNFTDPEISITSMAEKFHVHPNYLSLIIKKELSMTFKRYVTIKRIEFAVSLMEKGVTSIKNIANSCGYDDELYFSKVFKVIEGASPKLTLQKVQAQQLRRSGK